MSRCSAITKGGTPCKGTPLPDSSFCYTHDPARSEERRANASKGGKRGGRGRPLTDVSEIKQRLSDLADATLEGEVDTRVAGVVSQVLNVLLRAVTVELQVKEQQELEQRLEELEQALEHRRESYGA